MTITLLHYLVLSMTVFCIGLIGIFQNLRNLIVILVCIEFMLFSVFLNLVAFGNFLHHMTGQILTIFTLTITVAETVVGLSIFLLYSRVHSLTKTDQSHE